MEISALMIKDGKHFVASCLDYSIVAWTETKEELRNKFRDMVAAFIYIDITSGRDPFSRKDEVDLEQLKQWWEGEIMESQQIFVTNLSGLHLMRTREQEQKLKGPWEVTVKWRRCGEEELDVGQFG